jgi:hypothetical protein
MRLLAIALLCFAAPAEDIESENLRHLLTVKRVYVDRLSGGETAAQMRDILIAALNATKLFVITEKEDRADAVLRGAAEDLVFTEQHSSSDGINGRVGGGARSSSTRGAFGGLSAGDNESERSTERRHEAIASVRLVSKDGDVIWSTTQESLGAKFRGSSADVADKITARLKEDFDRARKLK